MMQNKTVRCGMPQRDQAREVTEICGFHKPNGDEEATVPGRRYGAEARSRPAAPDMPKAPRPGSWISNREKAGQEIPNRHLGEGIIQLPRALLLRAARRPRASGNCFPALSWLTAFVFGVAWDSFFSSGVIASQTSKALFKVML